MPRKKAVRRKPRKTVVTEREPQRAFVEPAPSTRLEQLRAALAGIPFGFTIFFTNERGKSVKLYCGAVEQEDLD